MVKGGRPKKHDMCRHRIKVGKYYRIVMLVFLYLHAGHGVVRSLAYKFHVSLRQRAIAG
jgi:hypothetical protein